MWENQMFAKTRLQLHSLRNTCRFGPLTLFALLLRLRKREKGRERERKREKERKRERKREKERRHQPPFLYHIGISYESVCYRIVLHHESRSCHQTRHQRSLAALDSPCFPKPSAPRARLFVAPSAALPPWILGRGTFLRRIQRAPRLKRGAWKCHGHRFRQNMRWWTHQLTLFIANQPDTLQKMTNSLLVN